MSNIQNLKTAADLDRAAELLTEAAHIIRAADERLDDGARALLRHHITNADRPLAERLTIAARSIYATEGYSS